MKTIELKIDGLCCTDCAAKVEKVLKAAKGVRDLKILMVAERAIVTYDETEINPAELIRHIEGVGHKAEIQAGKPVEELPKKRDIAAMCVNSSPSNL